MTFPAERIGQSLSFVCLTDAVVVDVGVVEDMVGEGSGSGSDGDGMRDGGESVMVSVVGDGGSDERSESVETAGDGER